MQKVKGKMAAVLIRDLIFETKIRTTGAAVGTQIQVVRGPQELGALLAKETIDQVLIDLNSGGEGAIEGIRTAKQFEKVRVVAFVCHVDMELASRAQTAGADEVMPRSRFAANLPEILSGGSWINPASMTPQ